MTRIIKSPSQYIQGKGELKNLAKYVNVLGDSLVLLVDKNIEHIVMPDILMGMQGVCYEVISFSGECCMNQIQHIVETITGNVIVGIGGGKVLDVTKAVAYYAKLPVVIVPTVASSDAPCSAISVLYTEDGLLDKYLYLPSNPNMVIVDTEAISKAPARLLVAGMGDALSTYFEARMCYKHGLDVSNSALALACTCYQTLLEDGKQAYEDCKNKLCTSAVENIIEANIYLSGIGFESGGLALAHSISNGLSQSSKLMHGEKVAYGTLVQLMYEQASELNEVLEFCKQVGLPTTLQELGITIDQVQEVAKYVSVDIKNYVEISINWKDIYDTIVALEGYICNYNNHLI